MSSTPTDRSPTRWPDAVSTRCRSPPRRMRTRPSRARRAARAGMFSARSRSRSMRPRPQSMVMAAEAAGVVALVGHEFRWAPDRALAARAIGGGVIGEPRLATLVQYVPLVAEARRAGAGVVVRRDPRWRLAGRVRVPRRRPGAYVVRRGRERERDAADRVASRGGGGLVLVRCPTASGVEGVIQQTAASWRPGVVGMTVVAGTDGTIELTAGGVWVSDRSGRRESAGSRRPRAPRDRRERRSSPPLHAPGARPVHALVRGVAGGGSKSGSR